MPKITGIKEIRQANKMEFVREDGQCYVHVTLDDQQIEDMRKFWRCFAVFRFYHYQAILKTEAYAR